MGAKQGRWTRHGAELADLSTGRSSCCPVDGDQTRAARLPVCNCLLLQLTPCRPADWPASTADVDDRLPFRKFRGRSTTPPCLWTLLLLPACSSPCPVCCSTHARKHAVASSSAEKKSRAFLHAAFWRGCSYLLAAALSIR